MGSLSQITPPGRRRPPPTAADPRRHFASPERRRGARVDSHSDVYSLGVLLLDVWCRYVSSRGLGDLCSAGGDEGGGGSVVEMVKSWRGEREQPDGMAGLLDVDIVRGMLEDDAWDRPDCFEVLDRLEATGRVPP